MDEEEDFHAWTGGQINNNRRAFFCLFLAGWNFNLFCVHGLLFEEGGMLDYWVRWGGWVCEWEEERRRGEEAGVCIYVWYGHGC